MNLDLKGKSVLVTGGNRGVGLGIALAFAEEGANVAVCGRDKAALAEAEAKIASKGVKAKAVAVDLFTAEGCIGAVQAAVDAFGGLDVLVNNASTAVSGNIETLDDDGLMERLHGKTLAYMRCCRAALPHLRKSGARSRDLHRRHRRAPGRRHRAAQRARQFVALSPSSSSSVRRWRPRASRRTSSTRPSPRPIAIPTRRAARAKQLGVSEEKAEASFVKQFPIGRIVEPSDIAPMVLFLASPHASAITGQSIAIDGGSTPGTYY